VRALAPRGRAMSEGYPRAVTTEALTRVAPSDFEARRPDIAALDDAARQIDGHTSLGDAVWRDLAHPAPDSLGLFVDDRAYLHLARTDTTHGSAWTAGLVRLPAARDRETARFLLETASAHVAEHGGGTLTCWTFGATDTDDETFTAAGFHATQTLYEMRAPLPIPEPQRATPGIEIRSFVPGRDDAEWLAVNNRAFAAHTDQGGWNEATLRGRMGEPWFDPELFLLAFDASGLAGFNWLKQHPALDPDPALGEIYVIGVDPRTQGTGLGHALALDGLRRVHERGAVEGMLFCAAGNTSALALYRSLGFSVHRTDRAYERDLESV
jgi:mycothiol synthase